MATHKIGFKGAPSKFDPARHPLDIYIQARTGATDNEIAKRLGVTAPTIEYWRQHYEGVEYALRLARSEDGKSGVEHFKEYVYERLSEEMKKHWDFINIWSDHPNGAQRIEAFLQPLGTEVRQSLWLHAMMHCDFHVPNACKMVNVSRLQVKRWTENDPRFLQLMDEIVWAKKHFYEGGLIKLVKEGNVMATIFANKTQNADLGYNEKSIVQHRHSGSIGVDVQHTFIVSVDKLKLPLDVRRTILDAARLLKKAQHEADMKADLDPIQEAEIVQPSALLKPGRMSRSQALAAIGDD